MTHFVTSTFQKLKSWSVYRVLIGFSFSGVLCHLMMTSWLYYLIFSLSAESPSFGLTPSLIGLFFVFTKIMEELFYFFFILYLTILFNFNYLAILFELFMDILSQLYTLNYIRLIVTSCIFKSFIYINSIIFEYFNFEIFFWVGLLIPILIAVSFYFSTNKLRFFLSLSFISFFWFSLDVFYNIFVLNSSFGGVNKIDYNIDWSSEEYNLIFKQISSEQGSYLDFKFKGMHLNLY